MLIALPFAPHFLKGVIRERDREREREKERERETERDQRERGRGKGRGRERERKKERERERERKGCYCKRLFLLLLAPGSPPEKFAVIPKLGNKPRKVNWALSWSSALALEISGKTERSDPFAKGIQSNMKYVCQTRCDVFFHTNMSF